MEIRNARIKSVKLGREDHGIMTFMIFINFGGNCCSVSCGIGGYALDYYDKALDKRVFSPKSMEVISNILDVDLPGKYIRVKDYGLGTSIRDIGNILENKWFNIAEFFEN